MLAGHCVLDSGRVKPEMLFVWSRIIIIYSYFANPFEMIGSHVSTLIRNQIHQNLEP